MEATTDHHVTHDRIPWFRCMPKHLWAITGLAGVLLVISATGSYVWAQSYDGRIAPNVFVGPVAVGGMDPETARQEINRSVDALLLRGIPVSSEGRTEIIALSGASAADTDASPDLVTFRVDQALEAAMWARHRAHPVSETVLLARGLWHQTRIPLSATVSTDALLMAVHDAFPEQKTGAQNAGFYFTLGRNGWEGSVTLATDGSSVDAEAFFDAMNLRLETLRPDPIPLEKRMERPDVGEEEAESLLGDAVEALNRAPYAFVKDWSDSPREWTLDASLLAEALEPTRRNGTVMLSVSEEGLKETLDTIATDVEKPAVDARFAMTDGRVTEFQESEFGIALDRTTTVTRLEDALRELAAKTRSVAIVMKDVQPKRLTENANDLGIRDLLGAGTSNYRGSPGNRIKNIRNAVRLLNGIVIEPGETFSTVGALSPVELSNGYLPELVIKGDEIIPEVGGGLCQIGTTTFRAAMNSGLPVLERRNHSLVVNYYNDPSNGNPGTDATLYDPLLDLKFLNDTGHPILFQAAMDEARTELRFSFWGTKDGRTGSYTPPQVIRWTGAGTPRITETDTLAPGVEQCQSAHAGADTTFTYTIARPDGTKEESIFASHYRSLPKICLVGKQPDPVPVPPTNEGDATSPPEETGSLPTDASEQSVTSTAETPASP
ncbi:VanW family protein [Candidatus Uhrbacteria bacterium]|nr:VanW family protein [Candidatus Uhrbacteria bacterium]